MNDNAVDKLQTTTEMEVGLKFDVDARKGLRLYILLEAGWVLREQAIAFIYVIIDDAFRLMPL